MKNILSKFHPVWALSFRPFFILGSIAATLLIVIWQLHWEPYPGVLWHTHEMLHGFVAAAVVGFLFTASQNWTGTRGIQGIKLQMLVALWVTARIFPWIPGAGVLSMISNTGFWILSLFLIAPYLLKQQPRRNLEFFVFIPFSALSSLLIHFQMLGWAQTAVFGIRLGMDTYLLIIFLIAGRVIPYFTQKVIPAVRVRVFPGLEKTGILAGYLFLITDVYGRQLPFIQLTVGILAVIHLFRFAGWGFWQTLKVPILWILHSAYLWIILGLILKSFNFNATHALGVGGIGILIYGMMTRVSLGHTGRPIQVGYGMILGFMAINMAAATRVILPLFIPGLYPVCIQFSGLFWATAFILFTIHFTPPLMTPRPDRKPG